MKSKELPSSRRKLFAKLWTGLIILIYPICIALLFQITIFSIPSSLSGIAAKTLWEWGLKTSSEIVFPWVLMAYISLKTDNIEKPRWFLWLGIGSIFGIILTIYSSTTIPYVPGLVFRSTSMRILMGILYGALGIGLPAKLIAAQYRAIVCGGFRNTD